MTEANSDSTQNVFNISGSSVGNMLGSGTMNVNEATQEKKLVSDRELPDEVSQEQKKVILILAANPRSTTTLRLDEEFREIEAGLRRSNQRDQFQLEQRWAVQSRDLQNALLDFKPQFVHFSGHGGGEMGLILENAARNAVAVSTEALAGLFELFADRIECVVLNACYSEVQAKAIARHIPYVIGMNKAIGDQAAIEFSVIFYAALGAGESVEFAYKLGCNAIRMAGIEEYLTPVLKKRPD